MLQGIFSGKVNVHFSFFGHFVVCKYTPLTNSSVVQQLKSQGVDLDPLTVEEHNIIIFDKQNCCLVHG